MENKPFHLDQVAIRLVEAPPLYSEYPLNNPEAAIRLLSETLKDYDREVFAIINLRPDLKPININIVSMGALDQCIVHPREALKSVILSNASAIMMVHNHTTGNMVASKEDVMVTDRMKKICDLMGIQLMDHIIVGPGDNYFSFREKSVMPILKLEVTTDLEKIKWEGIQVAESTTMETKIKQKVSFTVAECSEFHNLGELHENVKTVKEAINLFQQIPPDRMHGIPAIGIRVTDTENPELFTEIDITTGKIFDLDMLSYVPEIANNKVAQFAIAEMLHTFPDAEIRGEVPEEIQKKVQVIESGEKRDEQLKEIMDKLEQGVQDVFGSDDYKRFLNVMAKMPSYSINNLILIAMQTNGKASMCQSFTSWKQMGRYVKQGEKGIKILAPTPYTIQKENDKLDPSGKPVLDADGEPVKEKRDITCNAFKVVSTFDVSQTDGKEIPSMGVNELVGNIEGYSSIMKALEEVCPVPISFENIEGDAKGYYHRVENRIAIQDGMSEVQTVKTTIHEMTHQKLHTSIGADEMERQSRNSKEIEAESVAYVICKHYGINTSDYSFGYVAGWSEGREIPELKASLETIRNTAVGMITAIDDKLQDFVVHQSDILGEKAESTKMNEVEKSKNEEKPAKENTPQKRSVKKKIHEVTEKTAKVPVSKAKKKQELSVGRSR